MVRHPKRWLIAASAFTLMNLAGAPFALVSGEMSHAAAHVVLMFIGAHFVARFMSQTRQQQLQLAGTEPAEQRLDRLQESLDAMAIEVERIGEAQRFMTRIAAERAQAARGQSSNDKPR